MRRLPIYFLVDTCLSMSGEPIHLVNLTLNQMIKRMRSDPQSIEIASISTITYGNNKVQILNHNNDLSEFDFQNFNCSGYSNINYGLEVVKEEYNKNFKKTTLNEKGDWKPILFVFSALMPSTKIDATLLKFLTKEFKSVFILTSSNEYVIKSYSEYFSNIISIETTDIGTINTLVNFWHSDDPILPYSEKVDSNEVIDLKKDNNINTYIELPPPPTTEQLAHPI